MNDGAPIGSVRRRARSWDARGFCGPFFDWYNGDHHHAGLVPKVNGGGKRSGSGRKPAGTKKTTAAMKS